MTAERSQRLESLFASVAELNPLERAAFLDSACADDPALRSEVESLLEADARAGRFIEMPALEAMAGAQSNEQAESESESEKDRRIGPYKLIREIGHGGMGTVYLAARDDDQFEQMVAIKEIRRGMDTAAIIRRFRHERQILAGLNHPNIARLLDGGATEDGLPWFALEYIEGRPLTEYCDEHRLSIAERLRLFLTVCAAIQYAHQNLVIHRDLKPGNILITAEGTPKLLDFGIAKLLHSEGSDETPDLTSTGLRPMTPAYASPEQARGESVATASDVYSLGVILYELLAGRRPYQITSGMSESEIARVICEQEPVRPSLAVTPARTKNGAEDEDAPSTEAVNRARARQPERLRWRLAGDLDNITLTALRKEPQRRYSSVEQFSEDIRRHLDGLPVTASPDTFVYRAAKLVRRNKASVTFASLAALLLLIVAVVAVWQAQAARRQATIAQRESDKARRINEFLRDTLSYGNPIYGRPGHGLGSDVKLVDAIRGAEKRIDEELKEEPEIRGELHYTLGQIWKERSEHDSAEPHFRATLELFRQIHGEHHPRAIQSLYYLGIIEGRKGSDGGGRTMMRKSVEMMRLVDSQNETFPRMLLDLGEAVMWEGKFNEAESLIIEAREGFSKMASPEAEYQAAYSFCRLGNLYKEKGEPERAQAAYHEYLERLRRLPVKHEAGEALYNLGVIDYANGNYQEAEKRLNEAERLFSQYLGRNFGQIADFLYYLASIHCIQKNYAKAEAEARRALEISRQMYGQDHSRTIRSLGLLSKALLSASKPARASPYLHEAMEEFRDLPNERKWIQAGSILGECLMLLKRYDEAERLMTGTCAIHQCNCSEKTTDDIEMRWRLVKLYEAWGKPQQAARYRF
ncbi:MAG TPA: protein kinase [Blastocatellia bacterium]|nr:protein kinase [Blastocatellia bacterium]